MKLGYDFGFGGTAGPWLAWRPWASHDGVHKAETWSLRQSDGTQAPTDAPQRGFVVDVLAVKTGWESASARKGVAPERRWNADPTQREPQPGPKWQRCFSVPIALNMEQRATWEQANLAARIALDDLCKAVDADPVEHAGFLPLVRWTGGTRSVQTGAGNTVVPVLSIVRWVPRPAVLDQPNGETGWDDDDPPGSAEPTDPRLSDPRLSDPPMTAGSADPGVTDEADYGGTDPWAEPLPLPTTPPPAKLATAQPAPVADAKAAARERLRQFHDMRKAGQRATLEAPASPSNGQADPAQPVSLFEEIRSMVQAHDPDFTDRQPGELQDAFLRQLVEAVNTLPGDLSDAAKAWFDQAARQFVARQPISPPPGFPTDSPEQPEGRKQRARRRSAEAVKPADGDASPEARGS